MRRPSSVVPAEDALSWLKLKEGLKKLSVAALAALAVSVPLRASAVSEENLLYLEAWRAVYQAYVDGTYNGQN